MLDGSASGPSEKDAPPNLSLKAEAFRIIEDLRARVHSACGRISPAQTSLQSLPVIPSSWYSGGPYYRVPLGRRDGLTFATPNATLQNLPPPSANASVLISALATLNLTATDLVALSGGHTIGIGSCGSFEDRLYPTQDATMDQTFARNLKRTCPALDTTNTTVLDIRTPNVFDNRYYVNVMNRQGLFTSDQDLYTDSRTRPIVTSYVLYRSLFFERFVFSMIKMGQLSVLTGSQGEIRSNCSVRNPASSS
ncbi:hypothetical protein MKX01_007479 [Papaver californicum]|nr:hypothetical protein MKX01_007479 [Papaver californicum]